MMPVILMTVIFLGCIFAFALTPDKPSETKKKSFEQVAPGTRSHLAIVPKNFGTQGLTPEEQISGFAGIPSAKMAPSENSTT